MLICELVGLLILNEVTKITNKHDTGIYRDDGLIVLRDKNGRQTDKIRQAISKTFNDIGFQIEIETNLKTVDFLDVSFNLPNNSYRPYKKPNNKLLYIHTSSNHPPNIIKQLPFSINRRLTQNSSNKEIFDTCKTEYEEALQKSGYKRTSLKFDPNQLQKPKRQRKRKIIWFNPPFSKNVKTNVAKTFLHLIDKHFPRTHKLHKIFNRNTVKVSYSCTENIEKIIKSHNTKITTNKQLEPANCNCRVKENCPIEGNCRQKSVIYKCTVTAPNEPQQVYIGLTEGEIKNRISTHKSTFRAEKYADKTTLAQYVWKLKKKHNVVPTITWSIIKTVPAYSNTSGKCPLCLHEKYEILSYQNQKELLNKRTELVSKCRHENKYMLKNYKSND